MSRLIVFFLFFFCSFPLLSYSQQMRIAYVNMNKAINLSDAGKRSKKILKDKATRTQQALRLKEQELRQKESELREALMLSEEAKAKKREEIIELRKKLQAELGKAQKEMRRDEQRHTATIFRDIKHVVAKIAQEKKYDLVLENNLKVMILFSGIEMVDITDQVITAFNKF